MVVGGLIHRVCFTNVDHAQPTELGDSSYLVYAVVSLNIVNRQRKAYHLICKAKSDVIHANIGVS